MSMAESIHEQLPNPPVSSAFRPARILIVDDEVVVREILARKLESLGYICECCDNGRTALDLLSNRRFDLALAGILVPEIGGVAFLKEAMRICPDVAVILVTSVIDIEVAVDALKDGAYDYITKPFSLEEMVISVSRALEKRRLLLENQNYQRSLEEQVACRTRQLKEALGVLEHTYRSTLVALSRALDSRDAGSDGHSLRVTLYATRLAQQLHMTGPEMRIIEQGVLLHDIGKIGIPDDLLRKQGKLSESELLLTRKHPEIGYHILSNIKFLREAAELVLHHHERYDGKGYPQHLIGAQINYGARIFAIADTLDELTSGRSYQAAISFDAAALEIKKMSGVRLDPALADEFSRVPVSEWETLRCEIADNAKRADFLQFGPGGL